MEADVEALASADAVGEPVDDGVAEEPDTDDESPTAACDIDLPPLEQPASTSAPAAAATAIVTPRIRPTSPSHHSLKAPRVPRDTAMLAG